MDSPSLQRPEAWCSAIAVLRVKKGTLASPVNGEFTGRREDGWCKREVRHETDRRSGDGGGLAARRLRKHGHARRHGLSRRQLVFAGRGWRWRLLHRRAISPRRLLRLAVGLERGLHALRR